MAPENKNSSATALSQPRRTRGGAGAPSRWIVERLLEAAGRPPVEILLWDGTRIAPAGRDPVGTLHLRSRSALLRLATRPDLNFGELYMHGELDVEGDLTDFLEQLFLHQARNDTPLKQLGRKLTNRRRANSLSGSRSNIHHHYDLGNEFYELWLDTEAMQYTCAYFPTFDATLEQAQVAKIDHVCRKLQLQPDQTVVEAGCGWGGLARHMAKRYGVRVRAYNISHEQVKYARERARAEGLDDRVEYIEDDYRNVTGTYDAFVSVGMLEHVGPEHYSELNAVIDRSLKDSGRGLIHSIGRNRATGPMNAWIEKRIFPGAYPPSLREMMDIFEPRGFSVLDVENLRLHYAQTLRHWLERFEDNLDRVRESFDESFIRAWRLYLAGSIATFASGNLQLFQVTFARGQDNTIPLTREHLYRQGA